MDCREAGNRLTGSARDGDNATRDEDLLHHLQSCRNCAGAAWASNVLESSFGRIKDRAPAELPAFAVMRRRIETRLGARKEPNRLLRPRLHNLFRSPTRRWLYAGGVAVVVAILVLTAVVPFSYYRTVGYEVAFGGVQREFVEDDDRICDILFRLGLVEADVDVLGCDTTCHVQILYLKSRQEVDMVISEFSRLNNSSLRADVRPVRVGESRSLIEQVSEQIY